jgi:putative flavoprotein involved in K+ transport
MRPAWPHPYGPAMSSDNGTETVDTLVIGGGQAGLSTSYWLSEAGVEHLVLEGRHCLGGSWPDRWDSFRLVGPNFTVRLPGMHYDGPEPDGFMPRDEVVDYVRRYASTIGAPIRLGARVSRLAAAGDGSGAFEAVTDRTTYRARNVVLATGPYQRPHVPAAASGLPGTVQQLHSSEYRRPGQLAGGGVLVVGTGQSGAQIAEELHEAGRDVHLAVSTCPRAPRRYRGQDLMWWLMNCFLHGAEHGIPFPTVADLPTPAARFACHAHVSGQGGGRDIDLRDFARRGMRLYGRVESATGATVGFSDDLAERLDAADAWFDENFRPMFDAYAAAAGLDLPPDDRPPPDGYVPETATSLDLAAAGIGSVLWATGYRLDFGWVDLPIFDEWGYPRQVRGVTEQAGLYAVGLPWLHSEPSAVFAGVGADAAHVVSHIASRSRERAGSRSMAS